MKALLRFILSDVLARRRAMVDGWDGFWFSPADPTTLAAIRICTGLTLLYVHLACITHVLDFVGPRAWMDTQAIEQIRGLGQDSPDWLDRVGHGWWGWSVWCLTQEPILVWTLYAVFLAALVIYTLGWWSRTSSVLVWIGHLSYIHRSFFIWFGMDSILAMLTFYLMFGPTGAALSLDRRRSSAEPQPSWSANLVVRLIQVHMCVVYLCAGLAKLQGPRWWDGTAVWIVMLQPVAAPYDLGWLAHLGDGTCLLISNVGVVLTLTLEIGFAFLIWNHALRPVMLGLALLMHFGIGVCLGLDAFGAAMLTGCLAFVTPETFRRGLGSLEKWYRPSPPVILKMPRARKAA